MRLKTRAALTLAGLIVTGVAVAAPPLPKYEPDPCDRGTASRFVTEQ